jgi:cytosolic carboxypeptidase protein 2/3
MFGPQVPMHSDKYLKMRVIPKLISDETEMFRFHSCKFQNEKSKGKAARITLYKQFGIFNSFTLEASFHGYYTKDKVTHEFTEALYEQMGACLVNSLYEYVLLLEEDERRKHIKKLERLKLKKIKNE